MTICSRCPLAITWFLYFLATLHRHRAKGPWFLVGLPFAAHPPFPAFMAEKVKVMGPAFALRSFLLRRPPSRSSSNSVNITRPWLVQRHFKAAATLEPRSAGVSTQRMPAALMAAYLSFAVP